MNCVLERYDIAYIQNPEIEALYTKKIGCFEVELAEAEIAERRAKKKLSMCKSCIIRDVEIDEVVIDDILEEEFNNWLNSENDTSGATVSIYQGKSEFSRSIDFDPERLKKLYRLLCKRLHPDLVSDLTDKERADFSAVQICYDSNDFVGLVAFCDKYEIDTQDRYEAMEPSELASKIEDLKIQEASQLESLRKLKDSFPYCMKNKLNDASWVKSTTEALERKCEQVKKHIAQLNAQINYVIETRQA